MTNQLDLRNQSGLEFTDISSERWREYLFADGETVVIDNPLQLHVSQTGHRILDAQGISHFVPTTWKQLRWEARENAPHFVR